MSKAKYVDMQGNELVLTDEEFNVMPFNSRLTKVCDVSEEAEKETKKLR